MSEIKNDIIIGISTGFAEAAISIIRLSGEGSIELVSEVFSNKKILNAPSHTIHYGFIVDNNEKIDEVLVSVFKAPKTYTTEDVVEINTHGGIFVTNKVYELLVLHGARPAQPGEFTKKAFLNGRIDLTEAESVMDMINAESDSACKLASRGIQGQIRNTVESLRERLLSIIERVEVNIDYPEYDDVQELEANEIEPAVRKINSELKDLILHSKSAKYLKNGVDTAIIGSPNVGKSSLLNAIIEENKAIVTAIPGTTRDTVEAKINLGNVTLNLIDTAGIRKSSDIVESIGVSKSLELIESADLVLFVVDGSRETTQEEIELYSKVKNKKHLVIVNKSDFEPKFNAQLFDKYIYISALNNNDVLYLKKQIEAYCGLESIVNKDITFISNARQLEKLRLASDAMDTAIQTLESDSFIDFIELYLKSAWMYLGEIIGETSNDDLINDLFSKFCLGK